MILTDFVLTGGSRARYLQEDMRVFVTGGSGFIGYYLLLELMRKGHEARCLVRPPSRAKLARNRWIKPVLGDFASPESYSESLAGCEAIVNLVGIIRESRGATYETLHIRGLKGLLAAAKRHGVGRFIQISAIGARPNGTPYQRTKAIAEEEVKNSGLGFTILRPSIVFGPGDRFTNLFARIFRIAPIVPVVGSPEMKLQPIAVQNLAEAIAKALSTDAAKEKIIEAGGPDVLTFRRILEEIAAALGKKRRLIFLSPPLVRPAVRILERLPLFPLTSEQLTLLGEDNVASTNELFTLFAINPIPFSEGIRRYLPSGTYMAGMRTGDPRHS